MAEDIEHYKQRLRDLLPYARHAEECARTKWGKRSVTYVVDPEPRCNCGFAALQVIVWAEVGTNREPYG